MDSGCGGWALAHTAAQRTAIAIAGEIRSYLIDSTGCGGEVRLDVERARVLVRDVSYWPDEFTQFLRNKHAVKVDIHGSEDEGMHGGFVVCVQVLPPNGVAVGFGILAVLAIVFGLVIFAQYAAMVDNAPGDTAGAGAPDRGTCDPLDPRCNQGKGAGGAADTGSSLPTSTGNMLFGAIIRSAGDAILDGSA